MSNYRSGSIQTSGRVGGRSFRVEYVNRAGDVVNPHTGKPIGSRAKQGSNKPYARAMSKENGLSTAKRRLPLKLSGAMFGNLKPIPTDPTVDPPPRVCFNCWQKGHRRTNCTRPVVDRFCNNCGRRNEDLRSCPRCSYAYKLWLEMKQAKERGEAVDEQLFMTFDEEEDEEIQEVNDPDEILQELIYQDQKTRELLEYQQRKREQRETLKAIYKSNKYLDERGAVATIDDNVDVYVDEHVNEPYGNGRASRREARETRGSELYDPFIDSDVYEVEQEAFHNSRKSSQQERHIGMSVYKERDSYSGHEAHPETSSAFAERYSDVYRDREERVRTPEPPRIESSNWRKAMANASSVSNSDPVQDILLLAKTISHLTPETQDLIMRQVIAERQEQTRQRANQQERQDNPW